MAKARQLFIATRVAAWDKKWGQRQARLLGHLCNVPCLHGSARLSRWGYSDAVSG